MSLDFRDYLQFAERNVFEAENTSSDHSVQGFLIPATIMAWSAIESLVNSMLDDFTSLPENMFELHERAFLQEKRIRLGDTGDQIGKFILEGSEYRKLEEKIFFLIAKLGSSISASMKGEALWQAFITFRDIRNALVHPRRGTETNLNVREVKEFIDTSKGIISLVHKNVWHKEVKF